MLLVALDSQTWLLLLIFCTIDPQQDHAMIMVKFAKECLARLYEVTRDLEKTLGPDTGKSD